jgi:hypothetical protein
VPRTTKTPEMLLKDSSLRIYSGALWDCSMTGGVAEEGRRVAVGTEAPFSPGRNSPSGPL